VNNLTSTTGPVDYDFFGHLVDCIENQGYAILPEALPMTLVDGLYLYLKSLDTEVFKPAGIGRQSDEMTNLFVRTDRIRWLDPAIPIIAEYLDWTERLRLAVNRRLFLGLFDYECHFAHYPPGAYYKRHLDAFQGERNRVLTTVSYFNPNWQPDDGGQLLIYDLESADLLETVQPSYGQTVIFLSERFPHEVIPAQRDRYTITGWYRVNNNLQGRIDPPS
jgi:SM-20-related protein